MTNNFTPAVPQGMNAFGEWFSEMFRLWSTQWQVWVLQGLIFFAIVIIPIALSYFTFVGSVIIGSESRHAAPPSTAVFTGMAIYFGVALLCSVLSQALIPGMVRTALKQLRGETISAGDIFSGMRYFWGLLVVHFLVGLGVLACGVGSLVLYGLLYLALPLMVDRHMPTGQAISLSWDTTKRNFWLYLLFGWVVSIIAGAGSAACYIGIIATLPLLAIGQAVAYERTFNGGTAFQGPSTYTGAVPPPPYMPGPQG